MVIPIVLNFLIYDLKSITNSSAFYSNVVTMQSISVIRSHRLKGRNICLNSLATNRLPMDLEDFKELFQYNHRDDAFTILNEVFPTSYSLLFSFNFLLP